MATTVIGVFDADKLNDVRRELVKAGFAEEGLQQLQGEERRVLQAIRERGFDEDDAREFADALSRGKRLLAAEAEDRQVDRLVSIMQRHEAKLEAKETGKGGAKGKERQQAEEEVERIPVVEEELEVEKRRSIQGGVRVSSTTSERPVQAKVALREEHVEVERHAVDRELEPGEAKEAFKDRTVEMTETTEEAEVGKRAHVVEEVTLRKVAEEHEETVRDKVRRTDVEVEKMDTGRRDRR